MEVKNGNDDGRLAIGDVVKIMQGSYAYSPEVYDTKVGAEIRIAEIFNNGTLILMVGVHKDGSRTKQMPIWFAEYVGKEFTKNPIPNI